LRHHIDAIAATQQAVIRMGALQDLCVRSVILHIYEAFRQ
jgi:hypothetical protein